jgi:hypothetical protein
LIKEAVKLENEQERNDAVIYLGKLMKTFYGNWNKETLDDSVIVNDIRTMSQGKLRLILTKFAKTIYSNSFTSGEKAQTKPGTKRRPRTRPGSASQWRWTPQQQKQIQGQESE